VAAAAAPEVDITAFITPEVIRVAKTEAEHFPLSVFVGRFAGSAPCWTKLGGAVTAAYLLELSTSRDPYVLIEGTLPRDEVVRCVPVAFAATVTVEEEGELVAFRASGLETVYAAWRGSIIVVGGKEQVTRVLHAGTPELGARWRARLAQLPPARVATWRDDPFLTNLFGVATTSYVIAIDRIEQTPKPYRYYAGRVLGHYRTAGDAAVAARRIKQGELVAPEVILHAVKLMKVTQRGPLVEIGFDTEMFGDMGPEQLLQWFLANARH
jgi:hypothetical protein